MSHAIGSAVFVIFCMVPVYVGYAGFFYTRRIRQSEEEIVRLSDELDRYRAMFEHLDVQKTEFISIASHQLRTPLAVIQGYIELLQKGVFGEIPVSMKQAIHDIDESGVRLISLADSLLSIAQIEQGSVDYRFSKYNFMDVVETVYVELFPFAESKHVELFLDVEVCPIFVRVDVEKIRHVVFNFIENAIKYAPSGQVHITTEIKNDSLIFCVTDNGCGFEPDESVLLFEKFYRAVAAKQAHTKGTGLGLYIARSFIEGHKGKIWSHSKGIDRGSVFGFSIPLTMVT